LFKSTFFVLSFSLITLLPHPLPLYHVVQIENPTAHDHQAKHFYRTSNPSTLRHSRELPAASKRLVLEVEIDHLTTIEITKLIIQRIQ
jgi:hypothetical protein